MISNDSNVFLSVVVLCYRTGRSAVPFIHRLYQMLTLLNFKWEIVLVGNYMTDSTDETPEIVKSLERELENVRAITLPKKGMMGWDMRKGLEMAIGKYIAIIDGDGQFPIESIISCLLKIVSEKLDMVKTYRVRRADGWYRGLISFVFNKIFKNLFKMKIQDVNSKPKIILRSKYLLMNLKSDDWFVDTEMMIRAKELNLSIGEIPIHFYAISGRASFVKPAAIFEFIKNLFIHRFRKPSALSLSKIHPKE